MSPQRKMYLMLCILRGHVYHFFWGRVYIFMGLCVKDIRMCPQHYIPKCPHKVMYPNVPHKFMYPNVPTNLCTQMSPQIYVPKCPHKFMYPNVPTKLYTQNQSLAKFCTQNMSLTKLNIQKSSQSHIDNVPDKVQYTKNVAKFLFSAKFVSVTCKYKQNCTLVVRVALEVVWSGHENK